MPAFDPSQGIQELQGMLRAKAGEQRRPGSGTKGIAGTAAPERRALKCREAAAAAERVGLRTVEGDAEFVEQCGAESVVPGALQKEIPTGGGRDLPGGDAVLRAGEGVV